MSPDRLRLITPDLALLDAALAGDEALAQALGDGYRVASGWLDFPEALPPTRDIVAADPGIVRWGTRLFSLESERTLVGWGGFKGRPVDGAVELGYAIAPGYRGRGLAIAAVELMLAEAWADESVTDVLAHTLPTPGPSRGVLERTGFAFESEVEVEGEPVWRFRRRRADGARDPGPTVA